MHLLKPRRWHDSLGASLAVFASLSIMSTVDAADAATEIVLRNLARPHGLALRPGGTADRYELVVAESGAGRVARWSNLKPNEHRAFISGFATASAERQSLPTGPLAVLFLDPDLIVVGVSPDNGQGLLRVFELPDHDEVLAANQPRERISIDPRTADSACRALARSRANEFVQDRLVAVVGSPNQASLLYKSRIQAGVLGTLLPFASEQTDAELPNVTALTTSPTGRIVAVASRKGSGDDSAYLVFFNPIDGGVELTMPLGLPEVVALAYNPSSSTLYAADFTGGIYRIDDTSQQGRPACRATRVAEVSRPTALAFAPDGALYVTTLGDGSNDGTLQVVTGEL